MSFKTRSNRDLAMRMPESRLESLTDRPARNQRWLARPACVFLVAAALLVVSAHADTVIIRSSDGKTTDAVECKVERVAEGWQLVIPSDTGPPAKLVLPPDRVVRIIADEKTSALERIERLVESNPREAMKQILEQWGGEPKWRERLSKAFRRALELSLDSAGRLAQPPTQDESLRTYGDISAIMDSAVAREILGAEHGAFLARLEDARRRASSEFSRFLASRAIEVIKSENVERFDGAATDLLKAEQLDPRNESAWIGLAFYWEYKGDVEKSKSYAAKSLESVEPLIRSEAKGVLNRLQSKSGTPPAVSALPAPTPAVTPITAPMSPSLPVARATPAPARAPKASYIARIKEGDWTVATDIVENYVEYVVGVPLFVMLFWVLPRMFLRARMRKGDFGASMWVLRVRYLGIFALVGYLLGSIHMPRRAAQRCPICRKPIDDPDEYQDFNFSICPRCGESIPPVYNLDEHIQHLVEQVEREIRHRRGLLADGGEKDATLRLVRATVTRAVRSRASDIHIDCSAEGATVRTRTDGVLYDSLLLPKITVPSVVSAIKVMANLDIAEKRAPQDGKFSMWVDKADID
ncbi:Flp pilus assembly complex ATPase component TadA, partial [Candidatus Sumerlaeota bacterium]|nr:Flp pilus assembly complex ATPase component TadA [Candidatus Sumerlaeota bacterium]